jgi:hypothetical protein
MSDHGVYDANADEPKTFFEEVPRSQHIFDARWKLDLLSFNEQERAAIFAKMTPANVELLKKELRELLQRKEASYGDECACPDCGLQWIVPVSPTNTALVTAKLDSCPDCKWQDPVAQKRNEVYQAELAEPDEYQAKVIGKRLGLDWVPELQRPHGALCDCHRCSGLGYDRKMSEAGKRAGSLREAIEGSFEVAAKGGQQVRQEQNKQPKRNYSWMPEVGPEHQNAYADWREGQREVELSKLALELAKCVQDLIDARLKVFTQTGQFGPLIPVRADEVVGLDFAKAPLQVSGIDDAKFDEIPVYTGPMPKAKRPGLGMQLVNCHICGTDKLEVGSPEAWMKEHVASPEHDRKLETLYREQVESARTKLYDYLKSKGRTA